MQSFEVTAMQFIKFKDLHFFNLVYLIYIELGEPQYKLGIGRARDTNL